MDGLDNALEQAAEAAKIEAEAHLAEAQAEEAIAEANNESINRMEEEADRRGDTAVEIAKIEADKEIRVAEIAAEAIQHDTGMCCSECARKFDEHQSSIHALEMRLVGLEQKHEASRKDVERIHVGGEKKKEEKKKPEKRRGALFL